MPDFTPADVPIPDTAPDDPRVGSLLGRAISDSDAARVVLIGFPSDEGVRINGGRPGAADGPDAIRRALYNMTPDPAQGEAFSDLLARTADLGNLVLGDDLAANQQQLGEAISLHLEHGTIPIILGGGHETAFGHFLGYVEAGQSVSILNWDAHADVRPLKKGTPHSGSPFRQALEHPSERCTSYTVAGLQPHSVAQSHLSFVEGQGGAAYMAPEVSENIVNALYAGEEGPCMVTFDLDAVDQRAAPGVSAPAVGGLDPHLWWHAAYRAGQHAAVTSMDIVELNPRFDMDHQTARVAALTVWHFLRGLAECERILR